MTQPSAYFAVRSNAAGTLPPMISVGRPSGPIASPSQVALNAASIASNSCPRLWKSAPTAAKSSSRPPTATPSTRRPPDSALTDAACLASSAPSRRVGASRTVVASLIRSVTAPAAASAISGS
jgi:hypothetical protein